jgi:2-polyprenyl-6-methoxyphenol hydroxylase-like FAD-dependent oxidoreductase
MHQRGLDMRVPSGDQVFDVVQIGYGPVGQTFAGLLGERGIRVAVYEKHPGLYALPRAGHIDHEIMRIFHRGERRPVKRIRVAQSRRKDAHPL